MIDLYFWPTGNGKKVVILLEERGLPYTIKPVNIGRGDQFDPDVPEDRAQQPHAGDRRRRADGRRRAALDLRVRRDHDVPGGEDREILPAGPAQEIRGRPVGALADGQPGPEAGRAGPFPARAASGKNGDLTYALQRFDNEAHRIFGVMNLGLFNKHYLAAGEYTIADMICYPWASSWETRGIDIEEFPNVKRWLDEIGERPAVKKAMALGPEFREDPATISAEEQARRQKLVGDQRAQKVPAEWVSAAAG